MSRENVELVQEAWDAFDRGDTQVALALFAADVDWDVSHDIWGAVVGGGHYRGPDGIASWLSDLYGAWDQFDMATEELIDAGDHQVIVVLSARGRGRHSGIEVEHHPAGIITLHDRKAVRVVWFPSREDALNAVDDP